MNWKRFGKAQMLKSDEYNQNVYMFMCLFETHWRYWQLMVRISDVNQRRKIELNAIEYEWNELGRKFKQGLI